MKVIYSGDLPEEIKNKLKEEQFVYVSEDECSCLMTDKVYDSLEQKFNLSNIEENGDRLCWIFDSIQTWIECKHAGLYLEFMGKEYNLMEFGEATEDVLRDMINEETGEITFIDSKDWTEDVSQYMKNEISTYIMSDIRDEINILKKDGFEFDYHILI